MLKLRMLISGIILLLVIAGCETQSVDFDALPTVAQFPTETETPIPSETPTATNTAIPTWTPSATATHTSTATLTATASFTPLPSATATASQTPTATATFTPIATNTPIATRTPATPVINVFQSNTVNTDNASQVLLQWDVDATSARIDILAADGTILQTLPVELVGLLNTTTPEVGDLVSYRLTVTRNNQEVSSIITVDLAEDCVFTWYFANPPSSAGCALAPPTSSQVTYQQFETGFMFRATVNGQSRVCAVQNNRNLYSCFTPQLYTGTPPVTPEPDEILPDPTFEDVFYNNLATGGLWYDIIGFATAGSQTTNAQQQVGASDGKVYIRLPNGIYGFDSGLTQQGAPVVFITITP